MKNYISFPLDGTSIMGQQTDVKTISVGLKILVGDCW